LAEEPVGEVGNGVQSAVQARPAQHPWHRPRLAHEAADMLGVAAGELGRGERRQDFGVAHGAA